MSNRPGRGRFVNLWRAPYRETDALALVRAVDRGGFNSSTSVQMVLRLGGSPLIVGGEQWGEIVDGPVGGRILDNGSMEAKHLIGQFASRGLERGELWTEDGTQGRREHPDCAHGRSICNVGPEHKKIRGSTGAFRSFPWTWNEQAQFPGYLETIGLTGTSIA